MDNNVIPIGREAELAAELARIEADAAEGCEQVARLEARVRELEFTNAELIRVVVQVVSRATGTVAEQVHRGRVELLGGPRPERPEGSPLATGPSFTPDPDRLDSLARAQREHAVTHRLANELLDAIGRVTRGDYDN